MKEGILAPLGMSVVKVESRLQKARSDSSFDLKFAQGLGHPVHFWFGSAARGVGLVAFLIENEKCLRALTREGCGADYSEVAVFVDEALTARIDQNAGVLTAHAAQQRQRPSLCASLRLR